MKNIIVDVEVTTVNPITYTHHGVDGLPTIARGVDDAGNVKRTVYLTGAALRAQLRHGATVAELRKNGGKLADAYLLAVGQDLKPQADEDINEVIATQKQRDASPAILDLFGTWKMQSRILVSNLLPAVNVMPEVMSFIRRDLDSNPALFGVLDDGDQAEFYARQDRQADASAVGGQIKVIKRELTKAKKAKDDSLVAELDAKIAQLEALKSDTKGDDQSDNSKHLVETQYIPAGIVFTGRIVVERAKHRDLPVLMDGLEALSLRPMIGGGVARGFGEVTAKFTIKVDGVVQKIVTIGGWESARIADFSASEAVDA